MKITYEEAGNTLKIQDGIKKQYLFLKALMILNVVNALVRIPVRSNPDYGAIDYFWIIIGITSLIVLLFLLFKRSTAENLDVSNIETLTEKSLWGRKRLELGLKNGTTRILGSFSTEWELAETKDLFHRLDIPS